MPRFSFPHRPRRKTYLSANPVDRFAQRSCQLFASSVLLVGLLAAATSTSPQLPSSSAQQTPKVEAAARMVGVAEASDDGLVVLKINTRCFDEV